MRFTLVIWVSKSKNATHTSHPMCTLTVYFIGYVQDDVFIFSPFSIVLKVN